jgi:alanyl-tRNA synthetase
MAERFYEAGNAKRLCDARRRRPRPRTALPSPTEFCPGNNERNYVLRKIMRRAIYHGREHLGFQNLFFHKVCDFVIDLMKEAYPELEVQRDFINKMVRLEEERFGATMTVGLQKLSELFAKSNEPNFVEFAKLYDTFGTPRDLIRVKLEEQGIEISEEDFNEKFDAALQELQKQSDIGKTRQADKINPIYADLQNLGVKSNFHGYDETELEEARVLALVKNDERVDALDVDDEGLIVLSDTPFYSEAGGQVGDTGVLFNENAQIKVFDTFAPIPGITLHKSKVEKGVIKVGDTVTAMVDAAKRDATRRNHTATHLLHAALREIWERTSSKPVRSLRRISAV